MPEDERIKKLNQDVLYQTRKMYGMFGQIQFSIKSIDDESRTIHATLHVKLEDEHRSDRIEINVAESIVRQLPVPLNQYKVVTEKN